MIESKSPAAGPEAVSWVSVWTGGWRFALIQAAGISRAVASRVVFFRLSWFRAAQALQTFSRPVAICIKESEGAGASLGGSSLDMTSYYSNCQDLHKIGRKTEYVSRSSSPIGLVSRGFFFACHGFVLLKLSRP
ncbi:hypothetical protein OBBRIDRAFT_237402 [Obba rivulosa]|uniref:Uncharacterized protein n=1 Tax=Obba rivulosa TaxID=1052685 RepID=A0A8E2J893_9APHY|nr:hypothetical protein OBBRIDRAFT_237402 [Obba rivulosa]